MKKAIKIAIILAVILALVLCLCACNYNMFDVNYHFTNAYVKINDVWVDVEIKNWTDYEGEQIQITLLDGTVMLVSSINCVLYNGELPKV